MDKKASRANVDKNILDMTKTGFCDGKNWSQAKCKIYAPILFLWSVGSSLDLRFRKRWKANWRKMRSSKKPLKRELRISKAREKKGRKPKRLHKFGFMSSDQGSRVRTLDSRTERHIDERARRLFREEQRGDGQAAWRDGWAVGREGESVSDKILRSVFSAAIYCSKANIRWLRWRSNCSGSLDKWRHSLQLKRRSVGFRRNDPIIDGTGERDSSRGTQLHDGGTT